MRMRCSDGVALVMALLVLGVMAFLVATSVFLAVLQIAAARATWRGTIATEAAMGAVALSIDEVEGWAPTSRDFGPWSMYHLYTSSRLEPVETVGVDGAASGLEAWRLVAEADVDGTMGRSEAFFVVRPGSGTLAWAATR